MAYQIAASYQRLGSARCDYFLVGDRISSGEWVGWSAVGNWEKDLDKVSLALQYGGFGIYRQESGHADGV